MSENPEKHDWRGIKFSYDAKYPGRHIVTDPVHNLELVRRNWEPAPSGYWTPFQVRRDGVKNSVSVLLITNKKAPSERKIEVGRGLVRIMNRLNIFEPRDRFLFAKAVAEGILLTFGASYPDLPDGTPALLIDPEFKQEFVANGIPCLEWNAVPGHSDDWNVSVHNYVDDGDPRAIVLARYVRA